MNLKHYSELTEVDQSFIDAVARNNGREPAPTAVRPSSRPQALRDTDHSALAALIEPLDPDMGYEDWLRICMALHNATDGSEDGLIIFDDWSMQGSKYPGFAAIEYKWRTLSNACERPVTIGTVIWMLKEQGHIPADIHFDSGSDFEICETEVLDPSDISAVAASDSPGVQRGAT